MQYPLLRPNAPWPPRGPVEHNWMRRPQTDAEREADRAAWVAAVHRVLAAARTPRVMGG